MKYLISHVDIKELGDYSGKKSNQRIDNGFEVFKEFGRSMSINYEKRGDRRFVSCGVVTCYISIGSGGKVSLYGPFYNCAYGRGVFIRRK